MACGELTVKSFTTVKLYRRTILRRSERLHLSVEPQAANQHTRTAAAEAAGFKALGYLFNDNSLDDEGELGESRG